MDGKIGQKYSEIPFNHQGRSNQGLGYSSEKGRTTHKCSKHTIIKIDFLPSFLLQADPLRWTPEDKGLEFRKFRSRNKLLVY